jgi:hypothetical protein
MTDKVAISIREKDYDYVNDACIVQMYATTENPLARRKVEVDDEDAINEGDEGMADDMIEDDEADEGEEDGLDAGNDGFDEDGVIEIDEVDQKPSSPKKNRDVSKKGQDLTKDGVAETGKEQSAVKGKKRRLLEEEDDAEEKEMLSKIKLCRKNCKKQN